MVRSLNWEQIALDRAKWCCLIRKGADASEAFRESAKQKESAKSEPRDHHLRRHSQN